jgi:hypothetical protein
VSLGTRIGRLEARMGAKDGAVLELHAFGSEPCPETGLCLCQPCTLPDHDESCRVTARMPLRGRANLIRVYGFWSCSLD